MTISTKWIRIGNIACAILLLALLALQTFQPFWTMPACTCTEECKKAKNALGTDKINADCPACSGYTNLPYGTKMLWCAKRPKGTLLESKQTANRDTTKEWTVTIQQYTWFPTFDETKGVTEYFASLYNGKSLNAAEYETYDETSEPSEYEFMVKDVVLMPVIVFFFGIVGGILGLLKSKNPLVSIFALFTGIWVVKDYLTMHIYQLGKYWQVHMGIGAAIIAFAMIPTVAYILRAIKWLNPKAAE